jgi:hypothetical protein
VLVASQQQPLLRTTEHQHSGSAAVMAGSHHLRFPDVIPVTRIAIGSALPEQSLSPWSSGTGFPSRGELARGMREIVKTANAAAFPAKGQLRTSHNLYSSHPKSKTARLYRPSRMGEGYLAGALSAPTMES